MSRNKVNATTATIPASDVVMTRREAAAYLKLSTTFLDHDAGRSGKRCVPFVKINTAVRYLKRDLDDFLESCRQVAAPKSRRLERRA